MELYCEERDWQRYRLKMMLQEWIGYEVQGNLLEFRRNNDKEWFKSEVMCYLLRENVFKLIDWRKLGFWLVGEICLSSAVNVQNSVKQLIYSMENQLRSNPFRLVRHAKACEVKELVCKNRYKANDSSSQQVYAQILDCINKLIKPYQDERTIDNAFMLFVEFPFSIYEFLLQNLNDSIENQQTKQSEWNRNKILFKELEPVLKRFNNLYESHDSTSQQDYAQIHYYLMKLVEQCDDEETIYRALRELQQFPFNKYQSELLKLIDMVWIKQTKQCSWYRHGILGYIIYDMLKNNEESLNEQTYEQLLNYLIELIDENKDEETIELALYALKEFPFHKYQSSLHKLIDSMRNKLTKQCHWNRILCYIIRDILKNNDKLLSEQTYEQLLDYLTKLIDKSEDKETIDCACSALETFPIKKILTKLIQNYSQSSPLNWQIHQDLLNRFIQNHRNKCCDIFIEDLVDLWFEYLRNVLHECDHMQLVFRVILLLEELCLEEYFDEKSEGVLKSELMGRVQSWDSECPLASDLSDKFDFDRYQVKWCARWCVHNLMDRDKRGKMSGILTPIKLSNDGFEARNDRTDYYPIPVRSQYSVTSGVYFYEVKTAVNGEIMLGWSTKVAELDELDLFKVDMTLKLICQQDGEYILLKLSDCHRGDVIGCLIDMDNRRCVFYCNGKEVVCDDDQSLDNEKQITFSSSPYYATAFLSSSQHMFFNFGQARFNFPPSHIKTKDFHKAIGTDERKYRLSKTCDIDSNFWFKHLPVDNRVDLFYRDKRQNECDELVKRLERDIEDGRQVEEMKKEFGCDRYIQAVIEKMGKGGDKVDVVAQWVGRVIEETIDDVDKAKLVELLYPYLHLRINSTLDYTKHRNICIVLSYLIKFSQRFYHDLIKHIRNEVFTYLTRTLTETSDQWTQLFALIALENMKLCEEEKKMIQEILNNKDRFKSNNILSHTSISQQLHFSCEHFLAQLNSPPPPELRSPPPPRPNPAALNSHDRTSHLKLSLDLFSARSDCSWQSVRSTGRVTKGIYYFEAVLLTNGPMRIGWSTKRTEIVRREVGGDVYSVAFDGFNRAVWHNDEKLKIKTSLGRWKAGDVVGCLIDLTSNDEKVKHFCFYLNGQLLSYQAQCPIKCSPNPYHASISLSAHQQVFLNFGQFKFQHPPNEDYLTFTEYPQDVTNQKSEINMNNNKITNAVISIESTSTFRDVSMINQITSPTVDNILKPGLTFVTCPTEHRQLTSSCCAEHEFLKQKHDKLIEKVTQYKERIVQLEDEVKTVKAIKLDEFINKANKCQMSSHSTTGADQTYGGRLSKIAKILFGRRQS